MKNRLPNGMTSTEFKAKLWLAQTCNLTCDQIRFHGRSSPDFELPDGRGFEVKLLEDNHFIMGWYQWGKLVERGNCSLILWRKTDSNPEAIFPVEALPPRPPQYQKYGEEIWLECAGYHVSMGNY